MLLKVQRVWVSSSVQTQREKEKVEDDMFDEMCKDLLVLANSLGIGQNRVSL